MSRSTATAASTLPFAETQHAPTLGTRGERKAAPRYVLVVWLSLIGVIFPSREMSIDAGVNLTPGRIGIIILLLPALAALGKHFRATWSDVFAVATAAWIVFAAMYVNGASALGSAAAAESLEFIGAYLIGRAFLWQTEALHTFLRVIKVLAILLVLLALADRLAGRWIVQEMLGSIFNAAPLGANYREGVVRATATLDHPILLGVFFSFASVHLISVRGSGLGRLAWALACLFGCFLSLSSAAIISWGIAVGAFCYDRLLHQFRWRWSLFWAAICFCAGSMLLIANAPLGWLITHLTLDPESGYFRYLIWNAAFELIPQSPFVGFAFNSVNNSILDVTVDSVWLVYALRFGLPMILFLFLANLTAVWPARESGGNTPADEFVAQVSRSFATVLLLFMCVGLTVHFWNFMWIYWGLCLGTRVSLKQHSRTNAGSQP